MSEAPGDDRTGSTLGERYHVDRRLAGGGMGVVYEATDTRLGRKVAVKVVHSHYAHDARILERFRREAEAAGGLEHPHIVQITDFLEPPEGPPFLVMELLQGESLADVIKRERTLPAGRAAFIAWQVLDALGAAHAAGIVHRDLKPANIFLTTIAGVHDVVKLVDFGVAQLRGSTKKLTLLGDMIGTPSFMSPEQVTGEPVDGRTDLYSLGVVLYGCLVGTPPFWSEDPNETLRRVLKREYKPLVEAAPEVDPALAAVIERALSARADDRYSAAAEMRSALTPWVEGAGGLDLHRAEPEGAAPPSATDAAPTVTAVPPSAAQTPDPASNRGVWLAVLAAVVAAALLYASAEVLGGPAPARREVPPRELLSPAQRRFVLGAHVTRGLLLPNTRDAGTMDASAAPDR